MTDRRSIGPDPLGDPSTSVAAQRWNNSAAPACPRARRWPRHRTAPPRGRTAIRQRVPAGIEAKVLRSCHLSASLFMNSDGARYAHSPPSSATARHHARHVPQVPSSTWVTPRPAYFRLSEPVRRSGVELPPVSSAIAEALRVHCGVEVLVFAGAALICISRCEHFPSREASTSALYIPSVAAGTCRGTRRSSAVHCHRQVAMVPWGSLTLRRRALH